MMWKRTRSTILIAIAVMFLIMGVLGLFLPFLQGILFILIGICILALVSPKFKAALYQWLTPHHRTKASVEKVFDKVERAFTSKKQ